jgi:putative hydrolase
MTDHSPNLTVANGLSTERLIRQLEEIEGVNDQLAAEAEAGATPFRVLSGIEVDINEDGTLDQTPDVLAALDIVVASVQSKLHSPGDVMTKRMLAAIEGLNMDILGHCTGRIGRDRADSSDRRNTGEFRGQTSGCAGSAGDGRCSGAAVVPRSGS